jgi:hypothetical protein
MHSTNGHRQLISQKMADLIMMSIYSRKYNSWPNKEWKLQMSIFSKLNPHLTPNSMKDSTHSYYCKAIISRINNARNWRLKFKRFLRLMTLNQEGHVVQCSTAFQSSLLISWEVSKTNAKVLQVLSTSKETSRKFKL